MLHITHQPRTVLSHVFAMVDAARAQLTSRLWRLAHSSHTDSFYRRFASRPAPNAVPYNTTQHNATQHTRCHPHYAHPTPTRTTHAHSTVDGMTSGHHAKGKDTDAGVDHGKTAPAPAPRNMDQPSPENAQGSADRMNCVQSCWATCCFSACALSFIEGCSNICSNCGI